MKIALVYFFAFLCLSGAHSLRAAEVTACFVPSEVQCADLIVSAVDAAKKTVRVQAYGFSHTDIIGSLARAHKRGVDVHLILDESNDSAKYSGATYAHNAGIPVLIDSNVAIAHNKVIIIDERLVITGSLNFTKVAAKRNAENVVFITDQTVARLYTENWQARAMKSRHYRPK
jgi:phosphatidylserine/phosphatidylglycerophosphate/cardiolipin synthase-like enzyme